MRYRGKRKRTVPAAAAAALVLILLGLALWLVPATGMRFSGMLLTAAGAFFLLLLALRRMEGERRWALLLRRALLLLFALGLALFAAMEGYVLKNDETDHDREPAAVIVLGAGVNGRTPSLSLLKRLEATLDYIADRPDIPIVVTGGQGRGEEITEARCMADWLVEHGVAAERILLEEQAADTRENLDFSIALLAESGLDTTGDIAVVSSDYHLARTGLLFGADNMIPVAAHMPPQFWPLTVNYYVREAFGVAYTLLTGHLGG